MDPYTETIPTDFLDGFGVSQETVDDPNEPICWGRMFPLGTSFVAMGTHLK